MTSKGMKITFQLITLLAMCLVAGRVAPAQSDIKGPISGRSGASMTVKVLGSPDVTVLLNPSTKVEESVGLFRHGLGALGSDGCWIRNLSMGIACVS